MAFFDFTDEWLTDLLRANRTTTDADIDARTAKRTAEHVDAKDRFEAVTHHEESHVPATHSEA